jgi:hypothetical protein
MEWAESAFLSASWAGFAAGLLALAVIAGIALFVWRKREKCESG